jgi:hypothetical protein
MRRKLRERSMKTRWLGWISLITLISVTLWLILMIWDTATAGPLETFEQVLAHVSQPSRTFTLTYLNAGIFTIAAVALMGGLYVYCRPMAPQWSRIGLVFVPVYGTLNLFAYLSQITLVPALLEATSNPELAASARLLLQLSIQLWPSSTVGFFNGLAYAILGIPSIIFGWAMFKGNRALRLAGWLLALNGIACLLGISGYFTGSTLLSMGTVMGGGIFWLALFPLTFVFLRGIDG